ncbi:Longin-like domain-containing protein [Dichotomopilus funicola]|uniref:Synaptobrevin homolog YKT6 n=1 Tax=Dichotomopilus funicola TaxID=1934379 RepID=A0AAN6UUR0_9PEZI|nr:Longin-like domain-containing protein [Dichotomopilus funicola]
MKLYYVGVLDNTKQPALQLCAAHELSDFSRFTRNEYGNFMTMISKTVAERTGPGQRQSVEEQDYVVHCYARSEGVAGVVITKDYPHLAAHSVLSKLMDQFLSEVTLDTIKAAENDGDVSFPALQDYLNNYQDANEASSIAKIQQELDDTKIVLHKAIDSVLQRGEKLDDLVAKSSDLSAQSKMFYKSAKKQNSCCILM